MRWMVVIMLTVAMARVGVAGEAAMSDEAIQRMARERVSGGQTVGIVVGVLDGKGTRVFAAGKTARENGRDVDGDTLFEIGSITKTFTCVLLAEMVRDGEVKLDDPISKYTPKGVKTPTRNGKEITLLDLATQSSGLPRMMSNFDPKDPENPYADYTVEKLWDYLGSYKLERDIGAQYEYSNVGMGLLGTLLARRAGTNYEALLTKRIFQPLGMTSTAIKLTPELQKRFAEGHDGTLQPTKAWYFDAMAPCGGIRSSVNDMLQYLAAAMKADQSETGGAFRMAEEPVRRTTIPDTRIGLAWMATDRDGHRVVWHNGQTGGYHSCLAFDPTNQVGAVILANAPADIDDFAMHIVVKAPDKKVKRQVTSGSNAVISLDAVKLKRYVGVYRLAPGADFNLRVDGNHLMAQLTGQDYYEIFPTSDTNFFYKIVDAQITFNCDADGKVLSLTLHQNGVDQVAPKISNVTPKARMEVSIDTKVMDGYAGTYTLPFGAEFTIRRDGEKLLAKLTGQSFYQIFPESETNFFYKVVDAQISFVKGGDGKTTALILHQNGVDQRAERKN